MRFGKEYEEYRKNTPFIIPRFRDIRAVIATLKETCERGVRNG